MAHISSSPIGFQKMEPLLTIAVPTYNRSSDLARLLTVLQQEVRPLAHQVNVLVSDNASSDDTSKVISQMAAQWPELITQRNLTNVGPDRNFCLLLERIESKYFWLIGDDDVPKIGTLARLVNLLVHEEPAVLYLQSEWRKTVDPTTRAPERIRYRVLDREGFAHAVHLWTTFISGIVVDRTLLAGNDLHRYVGTNLVQLGWVLPALAGSNRFVFVEDACVVARQDNTGGYDVLEVFGANFPSITRDFFRQDPDLAERLIDSALERALPSLAWATRGRMTVGSIDKEVWSRIRKLLGRKWRFWLVFLPLCVAPRPVAHMIHEALQLIDRLREKIRRKENRPDGFKSIGALHTFRTLP